MTTEDDSTMMLCQRCDIRWYGPEDSACWCCENDDMSAPWVVMIAKAQKATRTLHTESSP